MKGKRNKLTEMKVNPSFDPVKTAKDYQNIPSYTCL